MPQIMNGMSMLYTKFWYVPQPTCVVIEMLTVAPRIPHEASYIRTLFSLLCNLHISHSVHLYPS
jgi:hypothetical protein